MKNKNLVIGFMILAAILIIIGIVGYHASKPEPLMVQGETEACEYRISGKVPGRIEKLYVHKGDHVCKGDTLVYINSPEVQAKLKQVQAVNEAAAAQNEKAANGARSEQIVGAYQLWKTAVAQEIVMKKSYDRIKSLYEQKVIPAQKYDEVEAKYHAAVAQSAAARSQYDMAVNGAREEDKKAAKAMLDQAKGVLQEVEGYLSELYLTSPVDGVVSEIFPKCGELVGQGAPIMSVMDLSDMWFTFSIREDNLHSLKSGDTLVLRVPALDSKEVIATVNYLAAKESYATWRATKDSGEFDVRTFEVRAIPASAVEGLRPGMTVLVK